MKIIELDKTFDHSLGYDLIIFNWKHYADNRKKLYIDSAVMANYDNVFRLKIANEQLEKAKNLHKYLADLIDKYSKLNHISHIESVISLGNSEEYCHDKLGLIYAYLEHLH